MDRETLLNYVKENMDIGNASDVVENDCRLIAYLFDNCDITVDDKATFFVSVNTFGIMSSIAFYNSRAGQFRAQIDKDILLGEKNCAYSGYLDLSHTDAGWKNIISLGIAGIKNKIENYLNSETDEDKLRFYKGEYLVYSAAIRFLKRAAKVAYDNGKIRMAKGIENLSENAPSNLFEAMQTMIIYYVMQQMFDGTVLRSLGRVDDLLYPFYEKDKDGAEEILIDFFNELAKFEATANMPVTLCGSGENGDMVYNELSLKILEAYIKTSSNHIKLHILWRSDMPHIILKTALDAIRQGSNSIVLMNDTQIIKALIKQGAEINDANYYHVVGCYECGAREETTCSCNARVNLVKAVEYALNGGVDMLSGDRIGFANNGDFTTFEEFKKEVFRQLYNLCEKAMHITDVFEANYKYYHCAPVLSATYNSALSKGKDIYCANGAKYNNSSLNALGIATFADSLYAIKKLVFDDKRFTLAEFTEILKNNWADNETLRLQVKNRFKKYGNGEAEVDSIAAETVDFLYKNVSGKPNAKGGVYRLGLFSIDWRIGFGMKTNASADGRKTGEPLSQNTGATFGAERNGITAHFISAAKLDSTKTPNGHILDIDLHSSAVEDENGLNNFMGALLGYFSIGGYAVHFNVLDTRVLIDAKENPDLYPNLQVRLCGWNVLFNSLKESEKEEFILRSKK